MPGVNIFLSYRRDDSGHAGRLFDHLCRRFPGNVFRDVTGIAPGSDFVRELERKLDSCHVLVVVISKTWLTATNRDGRRRLEDPGDFVRLEVAAGLRRNVCVVPVLVGGAAMPSAEDLPGDLKALATRQAMEITERDFEDDVLRLCQSVERTFGVAPPPPPAYTPPEQKKKSGWLKLGLAVGGGAFLMFATLLVLAAISQPSPAADSSGQIIVGGNLNRHSPAPPSADPAEPAADPKTKATPAASPAPKPSPAVTAQTRTAAPAEEDDFFSPVGSWRIIRPHAPGFYLIYDLEPGGRVTARSNFGDVPGGVGWGVWDYDPDSRQLTTSGRLNNDTPFHAVITLAGREGDTYAVSHSSFGEALMSRQ
jgi:hypothetical protein